jgi:alpha,alpha-trehalase
MEIFQLGQLFEEVQMSNLLGDGKAFPDCLPKRPLEEINIDYFLNKESSDFNLKLFVENNFELPKTYSADYKSDPTKSAELSVREQQESSKQF